MKLIKRASYETAGLSGPSVGSVKFRILKARLFLRDRLSDYFDEWTNHLMPEIEKAMKIITIASYPGRAEENIGQIPNIEGGSLR